MKDKMTRDQKSHLLMRLMMFTVMISSMSALMFNVVLPEIREEFGLTLAQVSWLSSAYALIYAFGTMTYGKFADRFQLKSLLTFGLILFAFGSLIGLVSKTFLVALLGRCLQSAGAASIPAMALIIPVRYFTVETRGSALSMTAVGVALGGALAPVTSALVMSFANWRWLFLPSLLILLLLPLYRKLLEHETKADAQKPFDWIGGILLGAGISLLLLGVTNQVWSYLLFGCIALLMFIIRIHMVRDAFIPPYLFRNKKYSMALLLSFLISGIGVSLIFLTPILLSELHHLSSKWIGLAMVPAAAAAAILGRKGGKMVDRKGNWFLFSLASLCLMSCFSLLSIFTGVPAFWISFFLILGYVGQSFIQVAMSNTISRSLTKDQVGVGMGFYSMMNFIAQAAAAGFYGFIVERGANTYWNPAGFATEGNIFSSIYFSLFLLHVVILWTYRFQFHTNVSKENDSLKTRAESERS